ncbi:Hydroxymethylglutaryl-coenzyme A synthase, N-terminal [Trichophyton rubrum]|nr:Hydroxymethylglutaryl-coenzyme A synthase, N-terminal [Trichophyton rubrum]
MAQDVGIKAIEIYFPSHYVAQSELETFLGASSGKYTIGLGQTKMGFCDDREGTESILDKAKSCKSVLMQLFGENSDIERHTYDFYKGDLKSEYPIVDGQFSNKCYLMALDNCYKRYQAKKSSQLVNGTTGNTPLDSFDYFVFHAPNCKLVAKSYARLLYYDYLADPQNPTFKGIPTEVKEIDYESSLGDKCVEKIFMALTQKRFSNRVQPSLMAAPVCGNSYTASVYFGLVSLLSSVQGKELLGKRVGFFSYGSGLASSMYTLRVKGNTDEMARKLNLVQRLETRKAESPEFYDQVSIHRSFSNV